MQHHVQAQHRGHYGRLAMMIAASFVVMYALMYGMVNSFDNVFTNVNQVYMAGLMAAPMGVIELILMRAMYPNRQLNVLVAVASVSATILFWILLRQQVAVSDSQFLRSMIPHHAGAILMCERAPIQDAEITALCETIVSGQQAEIDWMRSRLIEFER